MKSVKYRIPKQLLAVLESGMIYFTSAFHAYIRFVDFNLFLTVMPAHAASVALMKPTRRNGANPPENAAVQERFAMTFNQTVPKVNAINIQFTFAMIAFLTVKLVFSRK